MINPLELMHGNYVGKTIFGKIPTDVIPYRVRGVLFPNNGKHENVVYLYNDFHGVDNKILIPIVPTESLLKNAGFVLAGQVEGLKTVLLKHKTHDRFLLQFDGDNLNMAVNNTPVEIYSVHQLQNMFFLWTGDHLRIKF